MSSTALDRGGFDAEQIKRSRPIFEVADHLGLELRRSSAGTYKARCPFHEDHTPSLVLYEDNHAHCFGCGWHGDSIDLVRQRLNLSFGEACRWLGGHSSRAASEEGCKPADTTSLNRKTDRFQEERPNDGTGSQNESHTDRRPAESCENQAPDGCPGDTAGKSQQEHTRSIQRSAESNGRRLYPVEGKTVGGQRAGERPSQPHNRPRNTHRQWDRLTIPQQRVMNAALEIYTERLTSSPRALAYLDERGISRRTAEKLRVGYSDGYSLERNLEKHGGVRAALELGLLRERNPKGANPHNCRYRELLAGRTLIPEIRGGQCIWFVGRKLEDSYPQEHSGPNSVHQLPKYLGLPGEKPVLGLERASGASEVYITEGVFDWLIAVGWGLRAVSFCGLRLPEDRIGFLAGAERVFGLLDADSAGRDASNRLGELLGDGYIPVELPAGTDVADLAKRPHARSRLMVLVEQARGRRAEQAKNR